MEHLLPVGDGVVLSRCSDGYLMLYSKVTLEGCDIACGTVVLPCSELTFSTWTLFLPDVIEGVKCGCKYSTEPPVTQHNQIRAEEFLARELLTYRTTGEYARYGKELIDAHRKEHLRARD